MSWKFEAAAADDEHYKFIGDVYSTEGADNLIDKTELKELVTRISEEAEKQGGIGEVQRLVHETTGEVLIVMDRVSDERRAEIIANSSFTGDDGHSYNRIIVMAENE